MTYDFKSAASEAGKLLNAGIEQIAKQSKVAREGEPGAPRLFFPNGVELIHLEFKVGEIDIVFEAAGEKAPKAAAEPSVDTITTADMKGGA